MNVARGLGKKKRWGTGRREGDVFFLLLTRERRKERRGVDKIFFVHKGGKKCVLFLFRSWSLGGCLLGPRGVGGKRGGL
jgi:hypothetical protein